MNAPLAAQLQRALIAAGIAVTEVSIGTPADKSTWKVAPVALQGAAQPIIDAFDMASPSTISAELTADEALAVAQKDLIATLGVVASLTDANWGTYTLAQKVAKVQAMLTTWKTIRTFVENNF